MLFPFKPCGMDVAGSHPSHCCRGIWRIPSDGLGYVASLRIYVTGHFKLTHLGSLQIDPPWREVV